MLSAVAVVLLALVIIQAADAQDTGLAGYWSFEEGSGQVAADLSGNDNGGTLGSASSADTSDPAWIADGVGGPSALSFDGVDDFVVVPDSDSLESPEISAEAWVRHAGSPGFFHYVLAKGSNQCEAASYAIYTGPTGGLFYYISDGTNYALSPDAQAYVNIWDGAWHHVIGTFDGNFVRLYVDGNEIGSGTPTTLSIGYGLPTEEDLYIGTYQDEDTCGLTNLHFPGAIDEVKIWTRDIFGNAPPEVSMINVGATLLAAGESITANGSFTDPDTNDTHTALWDWGDGSTIDDGTVDGYNVGPANHAYTSSGVYTVRLKVIDNEGGTGEATYDQYIVVYDPSAGFVTGGGWINSPEGACQFDACTVDTVGTANFGFVAKYKKGQSTPDGNTQFQFKAGNLNFHSNSYEWLVVSGHKAQYKGEGTINGSGNYGFKLFAVDEKLTPSTDVDMFRIKIWDIDNGDVVVYDNEMNVAEDADPSTQIADGNIVIQTRK